MLIFLLVGVAVAQPSTKDRTRALELFKQSDQHYKRGEFEKAADLLREAYGLYPEPLLLYNLARALEGLGDIAGAIEQYERYLKEAKEVEDRGAIERRIATLKEQLARGSETAGGATPTGPPDEGTLTPKDRVGNGTRSGSRPLPDRDRAVDRGEPPSEPSVVPWIIAGGGVAVVGAGGAFGYLSRKKHDDALAAPVQQDAAQLQDEARRHALVANVLFAAGGVVAVGGLTWGLISLSGGGGGAQPMKVGGARVEVAPAWVGLTWELP